MRAGLSFAFSLAVALFALTSGILLRGAKKTDVVGQHRMATLERYDFNSQRRSATDPLAPHSGWSGEMRRELVSALNRAACHEAAGETKPGYDTHTIDMETARERLDKAVDTLDEEVPQRHPHPYVARD